MGSSVVITLLLRHGAEPDRIRLQHALEPALLCLHGPLRLSLNSSYYKSIRVLPQRPALLPTLPCHNLPLPRQPSPRQLPHLPLHQKVLNKKGQAAGAQPKQRGWQRDEGGESAGTGQQPQVPQLQSNL